MTTTDPMTEIRELRREIAQRVEAGTGEPADDWVIDQLVESHKSVVEWPVKLPLVAEMIAPFYEAMISLHDLFCSLPLHDLAWAAEYGELTEERDAVLSFVDEYKALAAVITSGMVHGDGHDAGERVASAVETLAGVADMRDTRTSATVEELHDAYRGRCSHEPSVSIPRAV